MPWSACNNTENINRTKKEKQSVSYNQEQILHQFKEFKKCIDKFRQIKLICHIRGHQFKNILFH